MSVQNQSIERSRPAPDLSVVLVADQYAVARKTMRHLREQTVSDRLEIVIVTQSERGLGLDPADTDRFCAVQVVEVPVILPLALATTAGVRRASAPLVVLAETHAYPRRDWAHALIEAHRGPWAAVGAVIGNANPGTLTSWASLFLDYGSCVETSAVGVAEYLPGHHTSYKRQLLLQYDSDLEALMDSEILLHWRLRAGGHRLRLEPAARVYHLNVSSCSHWLRERFYTGRRFAATRSLAWSLLRRLLYAAGAPVIPLIRLPRVLRDIRNSTQSHALLPRVIPSLAAGVLVSAAGEMVGSLFGAGTAARQLAEMELHKVDYVLERDRRELDASLFPPPGELAA